MLKVLIIDDDDIVLLVERKMLQRCLISTEPLSFKGGKQALEYLKETNDNEDVLILLDINMPQMNGYEVCRRLKADPKTQNVPVVMCSSKGEEFDRYWGMKQGADAYVVKPFQPKELVATVKQLLKG